MKGFDGTPPSELPSRAQLDSEEFELLPSILLKAGMVKIQPELFIAADCVAFVTGRAPEWDLASDKPWVWMTTTHAHKVTLPELDTVEKVGAAIARARQRGKEA